MDPRDPSQDLTAAAVIAVLGVLVFAALLATLLTGPFSFDDRTLAWIGAALVGLGGAVLAAWAIVLGVEASMSWAERAGGDLLLVGVGVGLFFAGLPTFAAGVI